MADPLVSICCLTYNQKDYIAQTLDSMLSQKTDFPIEILIHDDASTDGTDEIIRSYAARYPEIIRPLFETENQFSKEIKNISGVFNFPRAKGKYIAMCEGDDFWNDPDKLQQQVDYMRENPDCTICFHSAHRINVGVAGTVLMRPYKKTGIIMPRDIINKSVGYPTASLLIRADLMKELPAFYMKAPIGDIPMQLCMAAEGYGYYIDKPMATYRYNAPGSWTNDMYMSADYIEKQKTYCDEMLNMYDRYDIFTARRFKDDIAVAKDRIYYQTRVNIRDYATIYNKAYRKFYREIPWKDRIFLRLQRMMRKR